MTGARQDEPLSAMRRAARFVREEFELLFEPAGTTRATADKLRGQLPARFRTNVAIAIALISILGAVVAWRASEAAGAASDLDRQALQYLIQEKADASEINVEIDHDQRIATSYAAHANAWTHLQARATQLSKKGDAARAREADRQAKLERQLALSLAPFFLRENLTLAYPIYDPSLAKDAAYAADTFLRNPRSGITQKAAGEAHDRAVTLVLIEALVLTSLFFLTLARFAHQRHRYTLGAIGAIVVSTGLGLWLLVEVGSSVVSACIGMCV